MMYFKEFKVKFQENFAKMTKDTNHLFAVDLDKDELWNLYLDSYPTGTNEIYRTNREHDCSCCRQFIKRMGNAVIINRDNSVKTIWDFDTGSSEYQPVMDALNTYVKSKIVSDVWVSKIKKIGTDRNFEQLDTGEIVEHSHFYLELPAQLVTTSYTSESEIKSNYRAVKQVFQRSLEEITEDSLLTILELIQSNTLYKGEEWKGVLTDFLKYKKEYTKLRTNEAKNNFAWTNSVQAGSVVGKIRNHSIGVLLVDVSENMDLDQAVRKYEAIVAPTNYRRPKAIFTQRMLDDAKKTIEKLGYADSLSRRFARLDDLSVNNILFSNKDSGKRISGLDVFEQMSKDVAVNPKKFSKIEEVSIENFINNILPAVQELEVLFENKHAANMTSLITAVNKGSKNMFTWDNPFSWAYTGNITDSFKANVKSAGGNVDGVLRFSIQWNDTEYNPNDFDAHCIEPDGNEIYFAAKRSKSSTTGRLDVDITGPDRGTPAVENITWTDRSRMQEGVYRFFVHNFAHRGGRSGFKAEIEFDGKLYSFEYNKELKGNERVPVAEVLFDRNAGFGIKEEISSSLSSKEVWNLKTNQFIPVSVVCFSPNYWDLQSGIGHRHYMFMLKDCINPESPNPFYNEFLKHELSQHSRVFEALASKMRIPDSDDQLSGLGFSSTKRDELIVKVKGQTERIMKVKI